MKLLLALLLFGGELNNLGADDYQTRERAEQRLSRHAWLTHTLADMPIAGAERHRRALRVREQYLCLPNTRPLPEVLQCVGAWYQEDPLSESYRTTRLGTLWADYLTVGLALNDSFVSSLPRHLVQGPWFDTDTDECTMYYPVAAWKDASALLGRHLLQFGVPRPLVVRLLCESQKAGGSF